MNREHHQGTLKKVVWGFSELLFFGLKWLPIRAKLALLFFNETAAILGRKIKLSKITTSLF